MYKPRLVSHYVKTMVHRSIRQCGFWFLFLKNTRVVRESVLGL